MGDFLQAKIDALSEKKNEWQEKYEKEVKEREEELNTLREKRGYGFEELTRLQDRMAQKEEEQRNAVMIAKQRKEQMRRMEEAVEFLQEQGRDYMERMRER